MFTLKNIVSLLIILFPLIIVGLLIWMISGFKSTKPGPGDLGFTVGILEGTKYEEFIWNYPGVSSVYLYRNSNSMWRAIKNKEVDIVVDDKLKSMAAIKNRDINTLMLTGDLLRQERKSVAFQPDDNALRQAINRGIFQIIKNGSYQEISKRYFREDILSGIKPINRGEPQASDSSWQRVKRLNTVVIAMDPHNPPFSYLNDNRQWRGFDVEIARAVCIQLGIKSLSLMPVDKMQMMEGLRNNRFDAVWGWIQSTPAMWENVIFSMPYCITGPQLITRKGSKILGPEALTRPDVRILLKDPDLANTKTSLNI